MLETSRFTLENTRDGTPWQARALRKITQPVELLLFSDRLRERPFTRGLRRVSQACRVHFNFVGTTRGFFSGKIIPRELAGEKSWTEKRERETAAEK